MYQKIICLLLLLSVCHLSEGMEKMLRIECRGGKCLLEMPREFLGRVFLAVSRLDDAKGYPSYQRGAALGKETALSFREGKDGTVNVFLHDYSVNIAESTPEMQRILQRDRVEFPFANCPLLNVGAEYLTIDLTEFLKQGEPLFEGVGKTLTAAGSDGADFYCTVVRSLPVVRRIWKREDDKRTGMSVTTVFSLLPEQSAEARENHIDVAFGTVSYDYFKDERTGLRTRHLITRWLLSPTDAGAWHEGRETDVVEPIIFYLDPAIPEQWKSIFIQETEKWQRAFETAGLRRAVMACDLPEGQMLSAVNAAVLYHDSIAYETADVVADPRSGQIIQARLHWSAQLLDSLIAVSPTKTLTAESIWAENPNPRSEELMRKSVHRLIGLGLGLLPAAFTSEMLSNEGIPEKEQNIIGWGYGPRIQSQILDNDRM